VIIIFKNSFPKEYFLFSIQLALWQDNFKKRIENRMIRIIGIAIDFIYSGGELELELVKF
jgi:hypothetical protein